MRHRIGQVRGNLLILPFSFSCRSQTAHSWNREEYWARSRQTYLGGHSLQRPVHPDVRHDHHIALRRYDPCLVPCRLAEKLRALRWAVLPEHSVRETAGFGQDCCLLFIIPSLRMYSVETHSCTGLFSISSHKNCIVMVPPMNGLECISSKNMTAPRES